MDRISHDKVTYHGRMDDCWLKGAQHPYVVFPSNPKYQPRMESYWAATTVPLGEEEGDRIVGPATIQAGNSEGTFKLILEWVMD